MKIMLLLLLYKKSSDVTIENVNDFYTKNVDKLDHIRTKCLGNSQCDKKIVD